MQQQKIGVKTQEEWSDGDYLTCKNCDRFVDFLDSNGFCSQCSEEIIDDGEIQQ